MEKPKVKMNWNNQDGNAFAVMGNFSKSARRAGWTKEQIDEVLQKAMSGDYDNLLATIMEHCE